MFGNKGLLALHASWTACSIYVPAHLGRFALHLTAITLFAVKSLRGQARTTAHVEPWGLAGDRRYLVVDPQGKFVTQRECPALATLDAVPDGDGLTLTGAGLPPLGIAPPGLEAETLNVTVWRDSVTARRVGPSADAWLAAALGRPCRLVYMDRPDRARPADPAFARPEDRVSFADGFPLLIASSASLDDLNGRLVEPVGMDRFRANLVVAGAAPWAEDDWRHLRIGPVRFETVKPCGRCIMTTTDQRSGARHPGFEPIRTLQTFRRDRQGQVIFGQNLVPRSEGSVSVGDAVEVLAG